MAGDKFFSKRGEDKELLLPQENHYYPKVHRDLAENGVSTAVSLLLIGYWLILTNETHWNKE